VNHLAQGVQEGDASGIGPDYRALGILDTQTRYARMHERIVDELAVFLGAHQVVEQLYPALSTWSARWTLAG